MNNDAKWRTVKHLLDDKKAEAPVPNEEGRQPQPDGPPRSIQPSAPENSANKNEPNQHEDKKFDWEEHLGDSAAIDVAIDASLQEEQPFGTSFDDDMLDADVLEEMFADPNMDMDSSEVSNHMVDAFTLAGADTSKAKIHVKSILNFMKKSKPTTFVEVFGGGSICDEANGPRRNLNLVGLNALDLRTVKPNGSP